MIIKKISISFILVFCLPIMAMDAPHSEVRTMDLPLILLINDKPSFQDSIRNSLKDPRDTTVSPRYVPLIMTRDAYEGDESDGEEDSEFSNFDFQYISDQIGSGQWEHLPFIMNLKKGEKVENIGPQIPNAKIQKMANQFWEESFGTTVEISKQEAIVRVALTVLPNRLRSISRSRNYRKIERSQEVEHEQDHIPLKVVGCHIVPKWQERDSDGKLSSVNQEKVARFFRAFKAWEVRRGINIQTDASAARLFRRHYENNFGAIVPFQTLRNTIKNDPSTSEFVRSFYHNNPNHPVYLLFFDDDFKTLRPFGVGLLSVYDKFIQHKLETTNKLPTFLSTGYRFATQTDISIVASEIDRWVRAATAHIIPSGVCYPEPNMAILAKNPLSHGTILRAQFDEKKVGKSKTESRDLIKSALEVGDITDDTIFFLPYAPLPTETPKRVVNKSKWIKADRNENGHIINWDKSALNFLKSMPQSHINSLAWAEAVVASIQLRSTLYPVNFGLSAQEKIVTKNIYRIAKSAVSKMFTAYSPISTQVLDRFAESSSFYSQYGQYLLNYENQEPILHKTKITSGTEPYHNYLRSVQTVTSIEQLRIILANLFAGGYEDAQKIEDAAKLAGKMVKDGILYYFDFGNNTAPAIDVARQRTIMYELEQRTPNLIALEATPVEHEQLIVPILSPSKPIPQVIINDHVQIGIMIIKMLKLPKKGKRTKITNKNITEFFSLNQTNLATSTLESYVSKIDLNKSISEGTLSRITNLITQQSQSNLLKDLANKYDLNEHDIHTIAARSHRKTSTLMEYGLNSSNVLQSNLTIFQFFQILGFFG